MKFSSSVIAAICIGSSTVVGVGNAFVVPLLQPQKDYQRRSVTAFHRPSTQRDGRVLLSSSSSLASSEETLTTAANDDDASVSAVRAPLRYLGPYPSVGLFFPNLATSQQRERKETGVTLDFVIDTAANVNTLNGKVASELELEVVGQALPGVTASGSMDGADTFRLGDCQLAGVPDVNFMTELTASGLPVAAPGGAGLLSKAFLDCFTGGVMMEWGKVNQTSRQVEIVPSITFLGDETEDDRAAVEQAMENLTRVVIDPVPITQLPSVLVSMNGVEMPALLDTGSPITVLNHQAAQVAGVTPATEVPGAEEKKSNNPFANFANSVKQANILAKAIQRGDILQIGSPTGPVSLVKSADKVDVAIGEVSCGKGNIFVGDIPGLAALNGLGVERPPAVVLGMDVLRTRPKLLYRGQQNEIYL